MAISFIAPAAAGNAVQIFLSPPPGAQLARVLRKRLDTIAAADDPGANVVFEGDGAHFYDTIALVNGTEYFYRAFYLIGSAWVPTDSRSVVPKADYKDVSPDVLELVRQRLELGFAALVAKGDLYHPNNAIPVLLQTPVFEGAPFPLITVHLQTDDVSERFVGESLGSDYPMGIGDDADEVGSLDGFLSSYSMLIIVWSLNGDVRNAMRRAAKAMLIANLPILEAAGMALSKPSFSDMDDMNTYPVPVYQATCSLTCVAPTAVETTASTIQQVEAISI